MATLSIQQVATANQEPSQSPTPGVPGLANAFQALLNLADIPDPGGGPPVATAEAGASIQGPNAQSNQPDLLPPPVLAGPKPQPLGTYQPSGPAQMLQGASDAPTLLVAAGATAPPDGQPTAQTAASSPRNSPVKGTNAPPTDPALLALV